MYSLSFKFMNPLVLKKGGPKAGSQKLTTVAELTRKSGHCGAGYGGGLGCPPGADPSLVFDINYNKKSWQRRLWDSLEAGVNINSKEKSGFSTASDKRLRDVSRILLKFNLRNVNVKSGRAYGSVYKIPPAKLDSIPALAKELNGIVGAIDTAVREGNYRTVGILKAIIVYSDGTFDVYSGEPYSFFDFLGIIRRNEKSTVFIPEKRKSK